MEFIDILNPAVITLITKLYVFTFYYGGYYE